MKVLQTVILLILFTSFVKAQKCGPIFLKIFLTDSEGQIIKNAKIETFDKEFKNKTFPFAKKISWSDEEQAYVGFQGLGGEALQTGFRISANGFENFEKVIDLRFGRQPYAITLKAEKSDNIPTITKLAVVYGHISDLAGRKIPKVRIAILDKGKAFSNFTGNLDGYYELFLPVGKYSLKFSVDGFKSSVIENFSVEKDKDKKVDLNLAVN